MVWDTRLTVENEQDFEHCQKTFCRLVLQEKYISYNNAVSNLRLQTLTERRKVLSLRFIERSLADENLSDIFIKKKETRWGRPR